MRTPTAAQEAVYALDNRKYDIEISIKNDAGTWVPMNDYTNKNWQDAADWGENLDQPVSSANITLIRNDFWASMAPLVTGSEQNVTETMVYVNREIRIRTAVVPIEYETQEADWDNLFEGIIDDVAWPTQKMSIACRDHSGFLQDRCIEVERQQGDSGLTKDAEDVIQDILTTSQTGVTLTTPVASNWAIKGYIQQRMNVLPALIQIADQLAWQVRQKWNSGAGEWQLTFFEPDRWKSVADRTFYTYQYLNINDIKISLPNIRTVIEIAYTDTDGVRQKLQYPENGPAYGDTITGGAATLQDSGKSWATDEWAGYELWIIAGTGVGQHETIASNTADTITVDTEWSTQPDSTSFYAIVHEDDSPASGNLPNIKYGRRFCGIAEEATKQIDAIDRAFYMARRIWKDVSEPTVEVTVEMPYFHAVELGDYYTLKSNGIHHDYDLTLAVVNFRHRFNAGTARTVLTMYGKPSSGYRKWFAMEFRRGVAPSPRLDIPATPTSLVVSSGIKLVSLAWSFTADAYHPLDSFEIQYSTADAEYDATDLRYEVPASPSWGAWATAPGSPVKGLSLDMPDTDMRKDTARRCGRWSGNPDMAVKCARSADRAR